MLFGVNWNIETFILVGDTYLFYTPYMDNWNQTSSTFNNSITVHSTTGLSVFFPLTVAVSYRVTVISVRRLHLHTIDRHSSVLPVLRLVESFYFFTPEYVKRFSYSTVPTNRKNTEINCQSELECHTQVYHYKIYITNFTIDGKRLIFTQKQSIRWTIYFCGKIYIYPFILWSLWNRSLSWMIMMIIMTNMMK